MKYCPVPSKSWNLCTCNFWSCYVQGCGRRCIYKKIHYMTLTQYVFDQGQCHTKWSAVPSTSRDLCTCIVWSCYVDRFWRKCIYKKILYMTFDLDLGVNITQNVAQYSLHHVTYAATKIEVATSNGLGDKFTRKYIPWPWGQGQKKCCPVPSTPCDLCSCKFWRCYVKSLRRRCIYKKMHYLTFDLQVKVTRNLAQYPLHHLTYATIQFEGARS